ncbi:uncharacterized protein RCO7_14008 [Rhynchosporium graminicola]|uniref:Uncharacterized protein n=1 Tax=Rhynchosporium graminicola TaxID=2792576 RepID=A0A1E1JYT1_9HELO|nr:uncharacterized protein RCO7_14008 [Rhynchosporium commune]
MSWSSRTRKQSDSLNNEFIVVWAQKHRPRGVGSDSQEFHVEYGDVMKGSEDTFILLTRFLGSVTGYTVCWVGLEGFIIQIKPAQSSPIHIHINININIHDPLSSTKKDLTPHPQPPSKILHQPSPPLAKSWVSHPTPKSQSKRHHAIIAEETTPTDSVPHIYGLGFRRRGFVALVRDLWGFVFAGFMGDGEIGELRRGEWEGERRAGCRGRLSMTWEILLHIANIPSYANPLGYEHFLMIPRISEDQNGGRVASYVP